MKKLLLLLLICLQTFVHYGQVSKTNNTSGTLTGVPLGGGHIDRTFAFTASEFSTTSLTEVELSLQLIIGNGAPPTPGTYGVHEDLNVRLVSPTGTTVDLVQDRWGYWTGNSSQVNSFSGFTAVNATVNFDDDHPNSIAPVATNEWVNGNFSPHNALSAFDGQNAAGTWTLRISDGNSQFGPTDYFDFITATLTVTSGIVDTTPPVFDSTPTISLLNDTEFRVNTDINEAGSVYYVLVAGGATPPTATEVFAGTGSGGSGQIKAGSSPANGGSFTNTFSVTGLTSETNYDVYLIAQDDSSTPNKQTSTTTVSATTTDVTPPVFDTTPTATSITGTTFTLNTDINEAGTIFYVIGDSGATPSANDVINGTISGMSPIASGSAAVTSANGFAHNFNITGLTSQNNYSVSIVARDDESSPNRQSSATLINVITPDVTPPTFDNAPTATSIAGTTLTLNTDINETGSVYYVIVADGATAPTPAEVVAGTGNGGSTVVTSGNENAAPGDNYANTFNVTGLTSETNYDIYVVAQDDEGTPNLQAAITKIDATTTDITPPAFDSTPNATSITGTYFTLNTDINEAGTIFYVVVSDGATAPTAANVFAGKGNGGVNSIKNGSAAVTSANGFANSFSITGLGSETAYDIYVVAQDDNGSPNQQTTTSQKVDITTTDITPPMFENSTPTATSITGTTFTLNTDINEAGTIYYVILPNGAGTPSSAQVKLGQNASSVSAFKSGNQVVNSAGFAHSFSVTGLNSVTDYDIYTVAQDDEGTPNLQAAATKIDVTTLDNTPPVFDSTPTIPLLNDTQFTVNTDINEAGSVYYVLVAGGATPPTATEVFAGTGSGGSGQIKAGSSPANGGSFTNTFSFINLTSETNYDVYLVAQDDSSTPNKQTSTTKISATTADVTPPVFDSTPTATSITGTTFTLNTDINEAGTIFYVIGDSGATPSEDDVINGIIPGGMPTIASGSAAVTSANGFAHNFNITGLTSEKNYSVSIVARDDESSPNKQSSATLITVITPDVTPPTFDTAPTATSITGTTFTLNTDINEAGTIYYVIATVGGTPSSAQVKLGNNGEDNSAFKKANSSVNSGGFNTNFGVTGLADGTSYNVYTVAEDAAGNLQSTPTLINVTTLDVTAPSFYGAGSTPRPNATGVSTIADIVVDFNENIVKGTGLITLYNVTGSESSETYDIANATTTTSPANGALGIVGDKLYINPTLAMLDSNAYAVQIATTAIDDAA